MKMSKGTFGGLDRGSADKAPKGGKTPAKKGPQKVTKSYKKGVPSGTRLGPQK